MMQALDALEDARHHMSAAGAFTEPQIAACDALRAALAHPAPAEPRTLTEAQLERHGMPASECPPNSQVMLVSSIRRLLGMDASDAAPPQPPAEPEWPTRAELEVAAAKAERRAIMFGDIVNSQVIAMRAAVVAAKLEGLDVGMQWIANTLCGPGHLPDLEEARALGGAQALWDKETAEAEAFRAAHPGPEVPAAQPPATAQPVQAPPGWVLVPVEPTDAMTDAGFQCIDYGTTVHSDIARVWAVMIAAAPDTPAPAPAKEQP
jgi:hypothetical protein